MPANTIHKCFPQPNGEDPTVWRYIDFAKLVDLLVTETLWYSRLDQLGDPYEGSYPDAHKQVMADWKEAIRRKGLDVDDDDGQISTLINSIIYVNCWCAQASESNALWRVYGGSEGGVALRTKYSTLCAALPDTDHIGRVTYLDYSRESFRFGNYFSPGMHKRDVFSYEHEVRVARWHTDLFRGPTLPPETPVGLRVQIDVRAAIDAIVVSPYAPSWAYESTAALVKKLGFAIPIVRSTMLGEPVRDRIINPKPLPPGMTQPTM